MSFTRFNLDPRLLQSIETAGFKAPTPIQSKAIPVAVDGRDLVGIAQTGTGKSAAFLLPILQRLLSGPRHRARALILAPTRELAEQIYQMARTFSGKTGIRSMVIYGGVSKKPQIQAIREGCEIIIACPGRLLDHVREGTINLSRIEILVLDEVDRMFDMGFLPDVKRVISQLPKHRQNLFFSATMSNEIRTLANQILRNAEAIQIGIVSPAKTVSHAVYPVPADRKKDLLYSLLNKLPLERALIFTRTKYRARSLAQSLEKKGYLVTALQGNMSQSARQRSIDGFRKGQYDMLVATDIASRGIDVTDISHVINFDIPDTVDAYIHRIGRTGRVERSGEAFTFVGTEDAEMVRKLEACMKTPIQRRSLDGFDYGPSNPNSQFTRQNSSRNGRGNPRARRQLAGS